MQPKLTHTVMKIPENYKGFANDKIHIKTIANNNDLISMSLKRILDNLNRNRRRQDNFPNYASCLINTTDCRNTNEHQYNKSITVAETLSHLSRQQNQDINYFTFT